MCLNFFQTQKTVEHIIVIITIYTVHYSILT